MRVLQKIGSSEFLLLCGAIGPLLLIVVFLLEGVTRPGYSRQGKREAPPPVHAAPYPGCVTSSYTVK